MIHINKILLWLPFLFLVQSMSTFSAPGDLNSSFGSGGIIISDYYHKDFITSCTVQPDDSIVVAGETKGFNSCVKIARFTPNGSIDRSFNTSGSIIISYGQLCGAHDISLQSDDKIIFTGYTLQSQSDILIARLNTDGTLDDYTATSTGTGAVGNSILQQPDTKIVIGGYNVIDQPNFVLVRYDINGDIDTAFGVDGIVTTTIGTYAIINQIALQNDNKIIAGGNSRDNMAVSSFALARYNTDGSLDTDFGPNNDGIVLTTTGSLPEMNAIAIQDDGYIVAAGGAIDDSDGVTKFVLARYDTNGDLDTTFGASGIVFTQVQYEAKAYAVIIQPDGKIIAGGCSINDSECQFALVRYNTNGSIDTSFGSNGIALTTVNGPNSESQIKALALQSNGNIIAAGSSGNASVVACYLGS